MERSEINIEASSKSHTTVHEQIIRSSKYSKTETESDSEDGIPSLHSDTTVINLTEKEVKAAEEKVKKTFKRRLDISTLERPGLCNIFPREEYKFEHASEYLEEQKSQERL